MREGVEIIAQGVLWNPQNRTYGAPDLLIRSDILHGLFPSCISQEQARQPAPDLLLQNLHYRIVDIKFTTLDLLKDGHAASAHLKYMVQVWLYNEALGRLQGCVPDAGFLLGRRWTDLRCTAVQLGITGDKLIPLVDAVILANHSEANGPIVFSDRVVANEVLWRTSHAGVLHRFRNGERPR